MFKKIKKWFLGLRRRLIRESYESMRCYVEALENDNESLILENVELKAEVAKYRVMVGPID